MSLVDAPAPTPSSVGSSPESGGSTHTPLADVVGAAGTDVAQSQEEVRIDRHAREYESSITIFSLRARVVCVLPLPQEACVRDGSICCD